MSETTRILKVPVEKELRESLRKEVALFVTRKKILPPSDLQTLEQNARLILNRLQQGIDLLDFTIVLLGNEIWRKVVSATPFHRRLLLLPKCLRNNGHCNGVFDDLGLVCASCKNCQIDLLLENAEKLGYSTLVAEGTTVAIGLVKEGSIDAVLGVSCMPVLQNSFEPVTHAAIPVIGIPLLNEGCENTSVDYEWLLEEMYQISENTDFQPLSVSLVKDTVHEYFTHDLLKKFFPEESETEKQALMTMEMGGHRMRPILSVLACKSYDKNVPEDILATLAIIIECFHKASLVHDDIEDNEYYRYGKPTLHKSLGVPMAINTGDYLIGKGYRLLSTLSVDAILKIECLKIVSSSHLKLAEGQGEDILFSINKGSKSLNDIIEIFKQKTGEAIKVALLMGAILGKAPENEINALSRFSEWFGIAYQIRDDLHEYREVNQMKNALDFPFLIVLLNQHFNNESFPMAELFNPDNFAAIEEAINKFRIEEEAEKLLNDYVQRCYSEINKLKNMKLRLSLYGITGKIFNS